MRITTWHNKFWDFGFFLSRYLWSFAAFKWRLRIEPVRDGWTVEFHNQFTGKMKRIPKLKSKGAAKVSYDV